MNDKLPDYGCFRLELKLHKILKKEVFLIIMDDQRLHDTEVDKQNRVTEGTGYNDGRTTIQKWHISALILERSFYHYLADVMI
jgi:hypothetical protein